MQAGWNPTQPVNPDYWSFTAESGVNEPDLNFGNSQPSGVSGTVYDDLYGTGTIETGDPGLSGWTVDLEDSSGNILETTTSASDGTYQFANLQPGTYIIAEELQSGWVQTQPVNPDYYEVTVSGSGGENGLNFGNFLPINVTGTVYNDEDGNGVFDQPPDVGLQGWTVNLETSAGVIVATTTSDANGNYQFMDVQPGNYIVADVLQSGWFQTQPVNPNYWSFAAQTARTKPV